MSEAWMYRLMIQAYAFVAGVVAGKIHPLPVGRTVPAYAIAAVLLGLAMFGFVRSRRGRFPVFAAVTLLALSGFLLGWGRYSDSVGVADPAHISKYTTDSLKSRTSVEGVIVTDPAVSPDATVFTLNPLKVRRDPTGEYEEVSGGQIEVTVRRTAGELYRKFSRSEVYGWRIRINAPLLAPPGPSNPHGFSYRDYLADQDIYAVQSVAVNWGSPPPIEDVDQGEGVFLTEWSLALKERMLGVFVQTIPHPESTFLAGVTLGIKSVLKDVRCVVPGHDMLMNDEFRVAGVTHVLAVSGFHVTIISGMLLAIFTALGLPMRVQAPIIIFCLVIFLIITGLAPSAMRATLMNSLVIFFLAVSRGGFKVSFLFSIAEAAFVVLMVNPKNIVQPAFTLSFAAVLSLALISGPVENLLLRLRGPSLIWAAICVCLITILSTARFWDSFSKPVVFIPVLAGMALGFVRCNKSDLRDAWPEFSMDRCPEYLRLFLVAQFAILLGMLYPLSSYYFGRYSLAGPYANLVAIPLTGLMVPIGLVAGLIGLIPHDFAMFLALILNATNHLLIKLFYVVSHYAAVLFPYPYIENMTIGQMGVYYAGLSIFVWWESILARARDLYVKFYKYAATPQIRRSALGLAAVSACLVALLTSEACRRPPPVPPGVLRVTFLSVPYGGSTVIQTPTGKTYLVDGSLNQIQAHQDAGERVIAPFLLNQGIKTLDAVILTNAGPEHTEGLGTIMEGFSVRRWFDPVGLRDPKIFAAASSDSERACRMFLAELNDPYLESRIDAFYVRRLCEGYTRLTRAQHRRDIPRIRPSAGYVLEESREAGEVFRISFLGPEAGDRGLANSNAALKIEYGSFSILFPGDLTENRLRSLVDRQTGVVDILVLPQHGLSPVSRLPEVSARLQPKAVILQAGNPRVLYGKSREAKSLVDRAKEEYDQTLAFYQEQLSAARVFDPNSRQDGAVVVESDGKRYRLRALLRTGDAGTVERDVSFRQ